MKRDDPKRLKARADLDKAQEWLAIVRKGIAKALLDSYYAEKDRIIIAFINDDFVKAIKATEAASEAYAPYRATRRIRTLVKKNP